MRTIHVHLLTAGAALALALPAVTIIMPATAQAQISFGINIRIGYPPPPIPIYAPPPLPEPGMIWVPGHWRWSDWIDDYYWVSGYWERPPQFGLLWTPAWWGWDNGAYLYHEGYWGREVGWYGGIDYGFGYHGHGWAGGRWEHGQLAYNTAVVNVGGAHVTNVYNERVTVINNGPRVSYAGGAGGVRAQPTPGELRASQGPHIAPTQAQQQRFAQAASNPRARASAITPQWSPPAVHRVSPTGAPIPRAAALKQGGITAGAPPQYQRQQPAPAIPPRPANSYTAPGGATPAPSQPRPAWQNQRATGTAPTPPTAPAYHPAPAASAYHPAPPAPAYHPAPPAPAYHPAPPAPAYHPAPAPKPAAAPRPEHEHEHQ